MSRSQAYNPRRGERGLGAELAKTTIVTVLSRLWQKSLRKRVRDGLGSVIGERTRDKKMVEALGLTESAHWHHISGHYHGAKSNSWVDCSVTDTALRES